MPIKRYGSVSMPENAREHRAVKRDETVITALESTGRLDTARAAKW
jgi:hypothetical protein